jgi:hypothetical protein
MSSKRFRHIRVRVAGPPYGSPSKRFQIVCGACGHDVYLATFNAAINRAHTMAVDHIPFSSDGSLSCRDWEPEDNWSGDEMRWRP